KISSRWSMPEFCNDVSARNRRWEVRSAPAVPPSEMQLRDGTVVPREVVEIIARRGVTDIAAYLEPKLKALMPDPSKLTDMDKAADRFCRAIEARECIAIFGDYDVDGATSTAILTRYLRLVGISDSLFYIPQRLTEGYGPNVGAME